MGVKSADPSVQSDNDWESVLLPDHLTQSRCDFVEAFGTVYEHSSWVAEKAWESSLAEMRATFGTLANAMQKAVDVAPDADKLALLRAHPELASKAALAGKLTTSSDMEQRGAGLDQCSLEELSELRRLNDAYRSRYGFPFILAVTGLSRTDIIDAMRARCSTTLADERVEAMRQVHRIAAIRLKVIAGNQRSLG